ncbi:MAG: hypothetical protein ABF750_05940 [Oenococcus oeni]
MLRVNNNLSRILIAKFFGTFGSEMLSFAIGLYILRRTGSALGMGISLVTGPIVSLFVLRPLLDMPLIPIAIKKL